MTQRGKIVLVVICGLIAAAISYIADPSGVTAGLTLLAAGLVLGEILVLRLENGTALPLSYAVLVVIASSFAAPRYACAVAGAELITALLGFSDRSSGWRAPIMVERILVAAVTLGAYDAVRALTNYDETLAAVLLALFVAAVSQLPVDLAARWMLRLRPSFSPRARMAWLAIGSSAMLMALGYRGVDSQGQVGIWGPVLFSTPLLAAWYAFERLDSATKAYHQTVQALAMAPEFGGIVPPGHSQRVAVYAAAMADDLGLSTIDASDLEMAALLHHLGQVTIDEPEDPSHPIPQSEVAAVTSAMLREIKPLAGAGDIVAGDASEPRRRIAVQILRVASDYDDLTSRDSVEAGPAIETLRSAPGFVYDNRVLDALERAVGGRAPVAAV